ncbi:hypothetical protein [Sphingomonas sp. CROZ-RG-20F-R02-07]|uniref:hypothetical protein n=1 Tax=Sphingomonas sp. CROZ-RG-20F-R02-07 TaxID=2914832 RepID=UPI001F5A6CB2|nr:hypothetical protein [Sphingomonas sp. CROZ-RG-20F-R02-07]
MVEEALPPPTGLASYFTPAMPGAVAPDEDGFLRRWMLLEPVVKPNRTNAGFTPSYARDALALSHYPGRPGDLPRDGDVAPGGACAGMRSIPRCSTSSCSTWHRGWASRPMA